MSTFKRYAAGLHNVGSYQVSGLPYITGSANQGNGSAVREVKYEFPYVTKKITVMNHANKTIRIHFRPHDTPGTDPADSSASTSQVIDGLHYVELDSDEDKMEMNVKCREIYISTAAGTTGAAYRIYAEMTNIPAAEMLPLTGSGITGTPTGVTNIK